MYLVFDAKILLHPIYTGVENYTKHMLILLSKNRLVTIAKPLSTSNKYLIHLWSHFILPFKKGNILFCPANTAPIFVPQNKKLVLTLHDVAFLTFPDSFSFFFKLYYKFIVPFNLKRANKIITVSEYSKKEIISFYPSVKEKIEVISLGVDNVYKILTQQKKNQILYVGSLNSRKNFVGVLKAFLLLKEKDINLIVVGNFSSNFVVNKETKDLIEKVKDNSMIVFRSNVKNDELLKLYNESKLFLFPSFYEGFGLPVLEAMACGTPVITSNASSLPEVGGDAVLYCNPHDIRDIKEKIKLVLTNEALQKEMIIKGLNRVKEFSWEKSAQAHLKIFEKVLKD